jgi:hypothetical protein
MRWTAVVVAAVAVAGWASAAGARPHLPKGGKFGGVSLNSRELDFARDFDLEARGQSSEGEEGSRPRAQKKARPRPRHRGPGREVAR